MSDRAADALPQGEALRRALRWLDDRAQDDPGLDRAKAVSEASVRFDLTPMDADFLTRNWAAKKA